MSTLWMGNLEPYMDEKFIIRGFATMGETVLNVRIIRHKMTGGALGYCFVEMTDEGTAERCLRKINGKPLPGANPPTRFKLNRATFGKQETGPMFSLFVGDLTPEVDDGMLYEYFYNRYPQCRGGKVVLDHLGNSKGCGFVQFPDERLQKRALDECQGAVGLGGKALRLSLAANNLKIKQPQPTSSTSTDTKTWSGYSQSYDPYNQYSAYGYGYPSATTWGYDQNAFGYYPGYDYSQYMAMQDGEMAAEDGAVPEDDGTEESETQTPLWTSRRRTGGTWSRARSCLMPSATLTGSQRTSSRSRTMYCRWYLSPSQPDHSLPPAYGPRTVLFQCK